LFTGSSSLLHDEKDTAVNTNSIITPKILIAFFIILFLMFGYAGSPKHCAMGE